MVWSNDWASLAACNGTDPDELFVQGAAQNRAKLICMGCEVRTECLADALDNRVEFGVWGGMTERERRALLRRRPEVTSWRRLLQTAREEHHRVTGIADSPLVPTQTDVSIIDTARFFA
jgi:WhiB family redox-sensing transcriptional regulator